MVFGWLKNGSAGKVRKNIKVTNYKELMMLHIVNRTSKEIVKLLEIIFATYSSKSLKNKKDLKDNEEFIVLVQKFCDAYNTIVEHKKFFLDNKFLPESSSQIFLNFSKPININIVLNDITDVEKALNDYFDKFNRVVKILDSILNLWARKEVNIQVLAKQEKGMKFPTIYEAFITLKEQYAKNNNNFFRIIYLNKNKEKTILVKDIAINDKYPNVVIVFDEDDRDYIIKFSDILKIEDSIRYVHYSKEN